MRVIVSVLIILLLFCCESKQEDKTVSFPTHYELSEGMETATYLQVIDFYIQLAKEFPEKSIEFVRAIAEGDLVSLHTHQIWPDGNEYVTMDFLRFDAQGKIVEHWDAIQQIPESSANVNPMY